MEENRSIQQLEGAARELASSPSGTAARYHHFRTIPLKDLSAEQVRFLLSQDIGTLFVLDRAMQILENDILADGDFYPGDLLSTVLNIHTAYWKQKPDAAARLHSLLLQKRSLIRDAGHKRLFREAERFVVEQAGPVNQQ